jgi:hypothetical protein
MSVKLNESEIRGIDFAVRVTAKSFPFIKGWEFSDRHYESYDEVYPLLQINLIVDLDKVDGIFDFNISDYWKNYVKKHPKTDISYLSSMTQKPDGVSNEKKIIEEDLNMNYQNIPERYKGKRMVGVIGKYGFIKSIFIQYYVTEPTQSEYYEIK